MTTNINTIIVEEVLNIDRTPINYQSNKILKSQHPHLAAILIDMQEAFTSELYEQDLNQIISSQLEVIKYGTKTNIPLITVEYLGESQTIKPLMDEIIKVPDAKIFIKKYNNAFENDTLSKYLKNQNITELLIMGINAMSCVLQSALRARTNGFKVSTADTVIASGIGWEEIFNRSEVKETYLDNKIHFYKSHKEFIESLNS